MGFFGFGKKDEVIDLGERYRKIQEKKSQRQDNLETKEPGETPVQSGLSFLGGLASGAQSSETEPSSYEDVSGGEDRKTKLAKRLSDMTEKLENLSNQIYHLQQRVELLERKAGI